MGEILYTGNSNRDKTRSYSLLSTQIKASPDTRYQHFLFPSFGRPIFRFRLSGKFVSLDFGGTHHD